MKCFARIDCNKIEFISKEIYVFLLLHTSLIKEPIIGWNFIDCKTLVKNSPNLLNFFNELKLKPRHAAVNILTKTGQLPMHVDEPPVIAKLNIPVINTQGWVNRWYKNDVVIDEVLNLDTPIIFNSQIAHSVDKLDDNTCLPRIVASFTFFNEPLKWLQ